MTVFILYNRNHRSVRFYADGVLVACRDSYNILLGANITFSIFILSDRNDGSIRL